MLCVKWDNFEIKMVAIAASVSICASNQSNDPDRDKFSAEFMANVMVIYCLSSEWVHLKMIQKRDGISAEMRQTQSTWMRLISIN